MNNVVQIVPASTAEQIQLVRQLFEEYATSLSFKLCFQNFQQELDGLPGDYAPPSGGLWLALTERNDAVGCVALRRLEPGIGEMKRLYVRPEKRGTGLGKRLTQTVLNEARSLGYGRVRLDTTPEMASAIRLYTSMGFQQIPPYRLNPIEGAIYMEINVDPKTSLTVVPIAKDTVELVVPLFDAYRQFYGQPTNIDAARRYLTERLEHGESTIFAVEEAGKALGFTQLYPSFSSISMKPIWILNDLYVVESARRRGVGALLLHTAREHAHKTGAARLSLSTAITNLKAQALYERDGWVKDESYFHYDIKVPAVGR